VPLIPGIMPIHNLAQALKFAASCGMAAPTGFAERFTRHGGDADALFKEGVAHALGLCEDLRREGAGGFHIYALNHSEMADAVCQHLNIGQ
jgi:methylenetetrahydrofolate reductase (NADPH)